MKKNLQKLLIVTNAIAVPVCAFATTNDVEQYDKKKKEQLEEVVVYAQQNSGLSSTQKITSQEIAIDPASNGNISDYLKSDPHVRFENSDANGFQQGEIKPENISINGAEPEQTSYYIDNINVNNDLGVNSGLFDGSMVSLPEVSSSQAYMFDANLLSSVVVHDSDVSASLGGFSGGAVVAKTKQYNGTDSVKLRYRTTRSQWTDFTVEGDKAKDKFYSAIPNGTDADFQPKFDKNFFSLSVEQGLTDNLGVVFGLSRRESKIDQKRVISKEGNTATRHHTRRSDNALVNFNYTPTDNDRFELGLRYSEYREGKYFAENINSDIKDYHNAYGTTLSYIKALDSGVLTTTLAYDHFMDKRESDATKFEQYLVFALDEDGYPMFDDDFNPILKAKIDLGGMGDSKLEQDNIHAEMEYAINPFDLGTTNHSISVGGLYQSTKYKFKRYQNAESFLFEDYGPDMGAFEIGSVKLFKGTVDTKYQNVALFAEDLIKVNNFEFRPGIRIERDDYLKNTNIAPRFVARWNPYKTTSLSMGLNRYYGRSFASMKLTEEVLKLDENDVNDKFKYKNIEDFKTPYADEISLGFKQQYRNLLLNLRYIHRENKKRLVLKQDAQEKMYYAQGKDYGADVYTLQVENLDAWQLGKTYWNASLGFDWTEIDAIDYQKNLTDAVIFDHRHTTYGKVKDKINNNTEEWMVRLGLNMAIPDYNINWTNKVYIKAPIHAAKNIGTVPGTKIEIYESQDYGTHVQWDTSIRYAPKLMGNHSMFVKFDVLNVLNRTRKDINMGDTYGQHTPGRQYWLEVGYEF